MSVAHIMPCIFSRQSSSMPGPSIIMPSTPSTLQANYAILPRENQSVFSPTLHVASVNKIEMNSVIIRLSGQGPLPVKKKKKKHIFFPPSLSLSRIWQVYFGQAMAPSMV